MARLITLFIVLSVIAAATVLGLQYIQKSRPVQHIDIVQFQDELILDHVSHWLSGSPAPNGFLSPKLDREWRPLENQSATLVSTGRLLYVLATGYDITKDEHYLSAVRNGADFLLENFQKEDGKAWNAEVDILGRTLSDQPDPYGYTFVIFGLTHAYRVTGEQRYLDAAISTWETDIWKSLRDARLWVNQSQDSLEPGTGVVNHNAMLHLFEALLELHQVSASTDLWQDIEALAAFLTGRLYNPRAQNLPWYFDSQWIALTSDAGGEVSLGHQIEWAYFLSYAVELGLPEDYLKIAEQLLDATLRKGYDSTYGGLYTSQNYDGSIESHGKDWWQQAELLRAIMHFAIRRNRQDLWKYFDQSLDFVRLHFVDPVHGGWFRKPDAIDSANPVAQYKGDTWKAGYHVVNMYREALRLHEKIEKQDY